MLDEHRVLRHRSTLTPPLDMSLLPVSSLAALFIVAPRSLTILNIKVVLAGVEIPTRYGGKRTRIQVKQRPRLRCVVFSGRDCRPFACMLYATYLLFQT